MLNHYRTALSPLPFAAALAASLVMLFTPASGVPSTPPGTDKIVHFLLFAALIITGRVARLPARWLVAGLVGYAVCSEFLQATLPLGRNGGVLDALADLAGIAAGAAVCLLWRRLITTRTGDEGLPD